MKHQQLSYIKEELVIPFVSEDACEYFYLNDNHYNNKDNKWPAEALCQLIEEKALFQKPIMVELPEFHTLLLKHGFTLLIRVIITYI